MTKAERKAMEAGREAWVRFHPTERKATHFTNARDAAAALVRSIREPKGRERYGRSTNRVARQHVAGLLGRGGGA